MSPINLYCSLFGVDDSPPPTSWYATTCTECEITARCEGKKRHIRSDVINTFVQCRLTFAKTQRGRDHRGTVHTSRGKKDGVHDTEVVISIDHARIVEASSTKDGSGSGSDGHRDTVVSVREEKIEDEVYGDTRNSFSDRVLCL